MTDLSVVICTYNGANRISPVLENLRHQKIISNFSWEVLVVDNNSEDDIFSVINSYQKNWMSDVPLRYCREEKQGLAFARRCAFYHTSSPLIGFLDDDNLPSVTWVNNVWYFGHQHPQAGAYGSEIRPIYDIPPPQNFHRIASLLAIVNRGDRPFIYRPYPGVLPAGAGMVIRRDAWVAHVPNHPKLIGVDGRSLQAKGEDVETLSYIRDAGWDVWHNPAMKIAHHIPAERLQRAYLLKVCRSVGLNRFPLRMIRYRLWQRPFVLPLYLLNDLKRLVLYLVRHCKYLPEDIVCACEFTLLKNSLISPIYHCFIYLENVTRCDKHPKHVDGHKSILTNRDAQR